MCGATGRRSAAWCSSAALPSRAGHDLTSRWTWLSVTFTGGADQLALVPSEHAARRGKNKLPCPATLHSPADLANATRTSFAVPSPRWSGRFG